MFAMVNITSQYKRDKLFKELSLTPLTKGEWLISKVLWYWFITLVSFAIMVAVGIFAFGAHITLTLAILPFLLVGPLLFVSLGMLVGTVSNSVESAAVVGNLITFPMMFLSGTFFPVSTMPQWLQGFAHVLPLFYVIEGLNNVMTYNNLNAALLDLGVIFVIAAITFGLAVRFFKWRED
jgi:ABC-2 type transport system permease protein